MEVKAVYSWNPPSKLSITVERLIGINAIIQGGFLLARHRARLMPPWLLSVISWFTLCKYVICTHCEHHGEFCEFYGLGKLAAEMFPKKRKSSISPFGYATEGVSMVGMLLLPFLTVGRSDALQLFSYALSALAAGVSTMFISCRRCVFTSNDRWKALCPNYQLARFIWRRTGYGDPSAL